MVSVTYMHVQMSHVIGFDDFPLINNNGPVRECLDRCKVNKHNLAAVTPLLWGRRGKL